MYIKSIHKKLKIQMVRFYTYLFDDNTLFYY